MIKTITAGVRSFAHTIRIEYNAHRVEQARRTVEREAARIEKMSKAQRAQHEADTDAILRRAAELRKPANVVVRAHAAARAKRDARRAKR